MHQSDFLQLKRYPVRKGEKLQAWDSADELLLKHIETFNLGGKKILILNDQFGALSFGLKHLDITTYTDSYVSSRSIQLNSNQQVQPLHQFQELQGTYDLVLIRIPKNMSFFEDMLCHLSHHLNSHSQVICGIMVKYTAKTSFDLLNKLIGKTSTSLAQKKARLIFANFESSATLSPYPVKVDLESFEIPFTHHSNLFSREKLDIGTRFFLKHIPAGNYRTILDLGCANGILGIAAKKANPSAEIIFSDDSFMAIQSATSNWKDHFQNSAQFHWTNCFENQEKNSIDLVLCNPPFHQGNTQSDWISWQMFLDSYQALKTGGKIRIIGNSHLLYQSVLKKIFGNSDVVARNDKFTIIDANKE